MKMMKCDPRAFARCPYSKECSGSPEHTSFYKGTECDYFNQQVIHAPLTNADRIRAMNDDELSEQLVIDVDGLQPCRMYLSAPTGKIYLSRSEAIKTTKEWLQQPAEED